MILRKGVLTGELIHHSNNVVVCPLVAVEVEKVKDFSQVSKHSHSLQSGLWRLFTHIIPQYPIWNITQDLIVQEFPVHQGPGTWCSTCIHRSIEQEDNASLVNQGEWLEYAVQPPCSVITVAHSVQEHTSVEYPDMKLQVWPAPWNIYLQMFYMPRWV